MGGTTTLRLVRYVLGAADKEWRRCSETAPGRGGNGVGRGDREEDEGWHREWSRGATNALVSRVQNNLTNHIASKKIVAMANWP